MKTAFTIPRQLTHGDELVVLSRDEYEHLRRHLAELEDTLGKIRRGEQEYRAGKTVVVRALSELGH